MKTYKLIVIFSGGVSRLVTVYATSMRMIRKSYVFYNEEEEICYYPVSRTIIEEIEEVYEN